MKTRVAAWGLMLCVAVAAVTMGGSLTPPPGPVGPTMKTLTEVEPRTPINPTNTPGDADSLFKITQHGSYYLTDNILGVSAKHGIEITSDSVTLDLNGFELRGVAGSLDGVSSTVISLVNIAVVNGSVRSWGDEGVDLGTLSAINCRVADLLASGNSGTGISAGSDCTVTNCLATGNVANGISTNSGCTISNCSASSNTLTGISASSGCTVTNCSAHDNTGNGISTGSGCTVTNCSASSNTGTGISADIGCKVADCTARANTLDGIVCTQNCVIRGNTCSNNGNGAGDGANIHATSNNNRIEGNHCTIADRGIDVDVAGNLIIKNTCSGNTIDWVFAADNVFGPIVNRTTPASAAVSGFAPSSLGVTDGNANFTY